MMGLAKLKLNVQRLISGAPTPPPPSYVVMPPMTGAELPDPSTAPTAHEKPSAALAGVAPAVGQVWRWPCGTERLIVECRALPNAPNGRKRGYDVAVGRVGDQYLVWPPPGVVLVRGA